MHFFPVIAFSDSFCLIDKSNHLAHSKKDCDWLILLCFIRVYNMMTLVLVPFENKVCFEVIRGKFYGVFIIKQLKKPWLCSVLL